MGTFPCLVVVALCYLAIGGAAFLKSEPTPHPFPDSFSVSFQEIEVLFKKVLSSNNGTWHYDFKNKRARYDHNRGQTNNFCDGQNLSPKDPRADCQLFFTPTDDLIVYYPGTKNCCRLCGKKEGCTILKPDWLKQDSHAVNSETINGMRCYGWAKKGAVTAADTWYESATGVPCRYHEDIYHIIHNLTFIADTFKVGPLDSAVFDVPSYCNKTCPHPYPPSIPPTPPTWR